MVPFFPNFFKLDYFTTEKLDVLQVALTGTSSHFLCKDRESGKNRLFSMGGGEIGQLGNGGSLNSKVLVEITNQFGPEEVEQISAGGYHVLARTKSNRVFGWGKNSKGQLATKYKKGE